MYLFIYFKQIKAQRSNFIELEDTCPIYAVIIVKIWKRHPKGADVNVVGLCTGIKSRLSKGSGTDRTCNYSVNVFVSSLVQENWDVRDCKGCHFSPEFTRCSGFALLALWALRSSRINGSWGTARLTHKSVRVWMLWSVFGSLKRSV